MSPDRTYFALIIPLTDQRAMKEPIREYGFRKQKKLIKNYLVTFRHALWRSKTTLCRKKQEILQYMNWKESKVVGMTSRFWINLSGRPVTRWKWIANYMMSVSFLALGKEWRKQSRIYWTLDHNIQLTVCWSYLVIWLRFCRKFCRRVLSFALFLLYSYLICVKSDISFNSWQEGKFSGNWRKVSVVYIWTL